VLVAHELAQAQAFADRLAVLAAGDPGAAQSAHPALLLAQLTILPGYDAAHCGEHVASL
jgi:hypothetical protein